jgi:hypothetical protein
MLRTIFLFAAFAFLSATRLVVASEGSARSAAIEHEQIAELVRRLDHDEFAERQAATQKLTEAGTRALPQLEIAAAGGNREASRRALEIVKQHFHKGDTAIRIEARETLARLAKNENKAIALRANDVINPVRSSMLPPGFQLPNARMGGLPPQFTRTVTSHESNGRREVDVKENGRRTRILTLPSGQIQLEFTEPINGRDVTRKINAKDFGDLRQKDAEAAQVYELYDAAPRKAPVRTSSNSRG